MTVHKSVLFAVLLGVLAAWGCQREQEKQAPPLRLSLALAPFPYSGLIAIADDQGFFKDNGLEVLIKEFPYGFATLEALSRGEAQMAMANDLVFAVKISDDPSLRAVASISLANTNEIVARRDSNIYRTVRPERQEDRGHPQHLSEYYLTTFLLAHDIPPSEVTAVNIPPAGMVEAIVGGEVDAVSGWDTDVYNVKKHLGDNAVFWPAQNNQDWHWLLITRESMTQSPEPMKRFLRALMKAEYFLLAHADEAKRIMVRRWDFDPEFIQRIWQKTRLNIVIDQSLVRSLETAARWGMTKEGKSGDLPNFINYIYTGALDEIDPRAVRIFR